MSSVAKWRDMGIRCGGIPAALKVCRVCRLAPVFCCGSGQREEVEKHTDFSSPPQHFILPALLLCILYSGSCSHSQYSYSLIRSLMARNVDAGEKHAGACSSRCFPRMSLGVSRGRFAYRHYMMREGIQPSLILQLMLADCRQSTSATIVVPVFGMIFEPPRQAQLSSSLDAQN